MEITPLNLAEFTQKQIQDANVAMGAARCANESRAKSEAKFVRYWTAQRSCTFSVDGVNYSFPLPVGKDKTDFVKHVLGFFAVN